MASRGPRPSAASLASTLATLTDAAQLHANSPARMHDVVDKLSFRIRDTEDLFQFCPAPSGSGSLWGLICESGSLAAGVLIRRLFVERLGEEFELVERHRDAVLFALEEYPENLGLLEVVSRCPGARLEYGQRPGGLVHMTALLEQLRSLVLRAPAARVGADRGCVGTTSGVYGTRDSDAFFAESDLLGAALSLLLAPECHALPGACAAAGGEAAASLRRTCLLVADISGLLSSHPRVLVRAFAFLSSAAPLAFGPDHFISGPDFSLFAHMLCTSACRQFAEDVLRAAGQSRMHDAGDVQAVRIALLGQGRAEGGPGGGLSTRVLDTRLMLCWVLLVLFHLAEMLHRSTGEPERFSQQTMEGFQKHLLPRVRAASNGALSSRWPFICDALGALMLAGEHPTPPEWTISHRAAFRSAALAEFLEPGGKLTPAQTERLLDPFGVARPSGADIAAAARAGPMPPLARLAPAQASPTALPPLGRAVASAQARAAQEAAAGGGRAAVLGDTPRRLGMKFESFAKDYSLRRDDNVCLGSPSGTLRDEHFDKLPHPLPTTAGRAAPTGPAARRAALGRARRPPAPGAKGFFYNAGTTEYIGC